jgi:hypothetical protein
LGAAQAQPSGPRLRRRRKRAAAWLAGVVRTVETAAAVAAAFGPDSLRNRFIQLVEQLQKLDVHPGRMRLGDTCILHTIRSAPAENSIKFSAGAVLSSRSKPDQKRRPARHSARSGSPGTLDIAGFMSMHGLDEFDLYAVGFNGEIWRRLNAVWQPLSSPTNVVLHCVRMLAHDKVYVCGQRGVILRGNGRYFEAIDAGFMEDDLWSLQEFRGAVYLASERALYRLRPDDSLEEVDTGLDEKRTYGHLHANDGVMWSFGSKHLAWTEDGRTWHDATP